MGYAVRICSLTTGIDEMKRPTYEQVKVAVVKAGRFSVFEATATPRLARIFTKLCADPTLDTSTGAFPWTNVRVHELR